MILSTISMISGCSLPYVEEAPGTVAAPTPVVPTPVEPERASVERLYQEGLRLFDRGAYAQAIPYFQTVIEYDERHLRAYLSLGDAYSMLNNYFVAESYYNKILQYDPQSIPALSALGTMYWKMGNYRGALSMYYKVLELDAANQYAQQQVEALTWELYNLYYEQGLRYKEAGDLRLAVTEWQKAHSLYPENLDFGVEIGNLFLQQQDYQMAGGYFQQALAANPRHINALLGAGKVQFALQHYNEAIAYFRQVMNLVPGDPEALALLQQAQTEKVRSTLPPEYANIFAPDQIVTRGDIAALLMVELMLEERLQPSARLAIISDITTHWAKPYILKVVQLGLMPIFPDRTFLPNDPIHKGELAAILDTLCKQVSIPLPTGSSVSFSDVHPDNIYHDAVLRIYFAGLMSADEEGIFGFNDTVSGREVKEIFEKLKVMIW